MNFPYCLSIDDLYECNFDKIQFKYDEPTLSTREAGVLHGLVGEGLLRGLVVVVVQVGVVDGGMISDE